MTVSPDVDKESADMIISQEPVDMAVFFQQELAAARIRLAEECGQGEEMQNEQEKMEDGCGEEGVANGRSGQEGMARSLAFGHRAGFDAFMTAYAFACYTVESSLTATTEGAQPKLHDLRLLEGVAGMKNSLASRAGNWKRPLQILRSHFTKSSTAQAMAARERIKTLYDATIH